MVLITGEQLWSGTGEQAEVGVNCGFHIAGQADKISPDTQEGRTKSGESAGISWKEIEHLAYSCVRWYKERHNGTTAHLTS